jgi:aromatic ring hydroxylase
VSEIIRLMGSHNMLAAPRQAEFADPALRRLIDTYLPGAGGMSSEERARIFRLAWDFVGSELGSRNEQYERFYLASGARNLQNALNVAGEGRKRADKLVDRFLKEKI